MSRSLSIARRPKVPWLVIVNVLVGAFLILPTLIVIPMAFTGQQSFNFPPPSWSTQWFSNFFSDPQWSHAFLTSLKIGGLATATATCLGTAAAIALARSRFRGKSALAAIMYAPLVVPVVATAVAVYAIFLDWHLIGTTVGFWVVHTFMALPGVLIVVSGGLRSIDRRLDDAAASLGANAWARVWQVTLPLLLPSIVAGAVVAFITSLDETVISLFLSTPNMTTLPVQMYEATLDSTDPTTAAAATMIFVLTAVGLGGAAALQRIGARRVAV